MSSLEKMKKININLLDENDFIIGQKASDSQILKIKLDMQLFTDNSTTTPETNDHSTAYCMSINNIKLKIIIYCSNNLCNTVTKFASFVVIPEFHINVN